MKQKTNFKVVTLSILALLFLFLSYRISFWFLLPIAIILYLNQKEILNQR
jgi:hypothetical protein